ncbi:MAG: PH domain-containing protein, partial [Chitinophaga rupis]
SILFFFLPIAGLVWLLHPTYYYLTDTFLGIKRPLNSLKIPYTEILTMRTIEISELGLTFRLFASGGLFGYLGLYNSSVLGRFFMWCTNKQTLVIIQCKTKIIVISPDDPVKFAQEYTSRSRFPPGPR